MKKMLVSIGVIILVVILPAGSWYYLQTGLDYRKAALKELTAQGAFDVSTIGGEQWLKSKTTLLHLESNQEEISKRIYDQFGEAETFNLWSPSVSILGKKNWQVLADSSQVQIKETYPEASFVLIDTAMQVRHVYNDKTESIVKDLISHIAIVLPRKKDKDIKMKTQTK